MEYSWSGVLDSYKRITVAESTYDQQLRKFHTTVGKSMQKFHDNPSSICDPLIRVNDEESSKQCTNSYTLVMVKKNVIVYNTELQSKYERDVNIIIQDVAKAFSDAWHLATEPGSTTDTLGRILGHRSKPLQSESGQSQQLRNNVLNAVAVATKRVLHSYTFISQGVCDGFLGFQRHNKHANELWSHNTKYTEYSDTNTKLTRCIVIQYATDTTVCIIVRKQVHGQMQLQYMIGSGNTRNPISDEYVVTNRSKPWNGHAPKNVTLGMALPHMCRVIDKHSPQLNYQQLHVHDYTVNRYSGETHFLLRVNLFQGSNSVKYFIAMCLSGMDLPIHMPHYLFTSTTIHYRLVHTGHVENSSELTTIPRNGEITSNQESKCEPCDPVTLATQSQGPNMGLKLGAGLGRFDKQVKLRAGLGRFDKNKYTSHPVELGVGVTKNSGATRNTPAYLQNICTKLQEQDVSPYRLPPL